MDLSPTGWIAHYQRNGNDPVIRNVVAWHEGDAHVYGGSGSYLVTADKAGKLVKLEEVDRVQTAVPAAPGWRVRLYEDDKDPSTAWEVPIAAWIVTSRGRMLPVSLDDRIREFVDGQFGVRQCIGDGRDNLVDLLVR